MSKRVRRNVQYAALPYRRRPNRTLEVMLITSLKTKRWIIPKGWPESGLKPHESAAREAMEEAGLIGQIDARPLGKYRYEKRLDGSSTVRCTVKTFALKVETQLKSWPEQKQRRRRWFGLQQAAAGVREPELREMISNLPALLKRLR